MLRLIELIEILKDKKATEIFLSSRFPGIDYDLFEVYLKQSLSANSEAVLFNSEDISNKLEIEMDGVKYINLFPLNMTQEMILEFAQIEGGMTNSEIAMRLLDYRAKDA